MHSKHRGEPEQWVWVLAHCLLHLGFGHLREMERPREWNMACDLFVNRFLADLKLGVPPAERQYVPEVQAQSEERLYERFGERGVPTEVHGIGTAGSSQGDMTILEDEPRYRDPLGPSSTGRSVSGRVWRRR